MRKNTNIKLVKEVFTEEITNQFLVELELVLKTIDFHQVEKLLIRYNIQNDPECQIFSKDIKKLFQDWKIEGAESVLVGNVETRVTKCFACLLGKSVIAYEFSYQHKGLLGYTSTLVYSREFAIFTVIEDKCLTDFGLCNAFLGRREVHLLNIE